MSANFHYINYQTSIQKSPTCLQGKTLAQMESNLDKSFKDDPLVIDFQNVTDISECVLKTMERKTGRGYQGDESSIQ